MKDNIIYILKQPLQTLCCVKVYQVGQEISIFRQDSPNRVLVRAVGEEGLHKIKMSSLHRCSQKEEYGEDK